MSSGTILLIGVIVVIAAVAVAAVLLASRGSDGLRFDIGGQAPRAAGGNDTSPEKTFQSRFIGLGVFSGGVIAALLARLWSMQIVSGDDYSAQAETNRTRTVTTPAPRGRILDRNGVELVANRPSLTVCAKSDIADDSIELNLLANLLGMPAVAAKRRATDSAQSAQSARTIAVDASRSQVAFIQEHVDVFPDVTVRRARSAPTRRARSPARCLATPAP